MSPANSRGQPDPHDILVTDEGMSESDARSLMTAADIEMLCG
jgi:hypothetical protein